MDAPPGSQAAVSQGAAASLSYHEALISPCEDCDAFCCCYLPLQVVPVRNLMEVDYLRYLLGFPRLQAGFSVSGQWSVYYAVPCRHFDPDTRGCKVHGTLEQPRTCVAYNEHDCWYQRAISTESDGFLLFDRHRLEQLLPLLVFDRDRNIASVPPWSQTVELCSHRPLPSSRDELQRGTGFVPPPPLSSKSENARPGKTMSELLEDPCLQCEAPCCRYLFFPLPVAQTLMQVDYVQFCLNFPGVECGISPASWWLLLHADCEFFQLEEKRCGLHGRSERPLRCLHLNRWDCGQYRQLLYPSSSTLRRMDREAFAQMTRQIRFDDDGHIAHLPNPFEQ